MQELLSRAHEGSTTRYVFWLVQWRKYLLKIYASEAVGTCSEDMLKSVQPVGQAGGVQVEFADEHAG